MTCDENLSEAATYVEQCRAQSHQSDTAAGVYANAVAQLGLKAQGTRGETVSQLKQMYTNWNNIIASLARTPRRLSLRAVGGSLRERNPRWAAKDK